MQEELELPIKNPVQAGEAAILEEQAGIEGGAIHDGFRLDLIGEYIEPAPLRRGPRSLGEQAFEGSVHPLGIGYERRAEGAVADKTDDGGGDVLVLKFVPGRLERGFVESLCIQRGLDL